MKINVVLSKDDPFVTPISFAEAVIDYWMNIKIVGHTLDELDNRRSLEEVKGYLEVFCTCNPINNYQPTKVLRE